MSRRERCWRTGRVYVYNSCNREPRARWHQLLCSAVDSPSFSSDLSGFCLWHTLKWSTSSFAWCATALWRCRRQQNMILNDFLAQHDYQRNKMWHGIELWTGPDQQSYCYFPHFLWVMKKTRLLFHLSLYFLLMLGVWTVKLFLLSCTSYLLQSCESLMRCCSQLSFPTCFGLLDFSLGFTLVCCIKNIKKGIYHLIPFKKKDNVLFFFCLYTGGSEPP